MDEEDVIMADDTEEDNIFHSVPMSSLENRFVNLKKEFSFTENQCPNVMVPFGGKWDFIFWVVSF